jgi:hypothetical protein
LLCVRTYMYVTVVVVDTALRLSCSDTGHIPAYEGSYCFLSLQRLILLQSSVGAVGSWDCMAATRHRQSQKFT